MVETQRSSSWDELREMGDQRPNAAGTRQASQAYAIELARFSGDERLAEAYAYARQVREQAQLADVWFNGQGTEAVVYTGRFRDADSPAARDALAYVREARQGGSRTFRDAKLVAVDRTTRDRGDPADLAQYSGYRSLLLNVYDQGFGPDFRRAAERAVEDLKQQHPDQSFYYYHGPRQSAVTTGLFTDIDFVTVDQVERYGPGIRALQDLFPHAQRNGQTIYNEEVPTDDHLEPTVVIRVP